MPIMLECFANALQWDLVGVCLALMVWPAFRMFFPQAVAWGAARLMAPALVAYFALLPALSHQPIAFNRSTVMFSAVALGAIAWLAWGRRAWRFDREFFENAFFFERAHLIFLALASLYVPFIASMISMGERLRDSGILNAILTQQTFPVEEPWFAGARIQYYTFGYYVPSTIGLFTGGDTLFKYNLIIVWTFAAYAAGCWLFFRALGWRWRTALLGASVVALSSNLASFGQALKVLFTSGNYDWWYVSRVIENTITEFPLWTASLGDLHPHFLSMPIFPLLLTWIACCLFQGERSEASVDKREAWTYGLGSSFFIAWIWGSNTWELPIFIAVAIGALWLCARQLSWKLRLQVSAGTAISAFALALLFLTTTPKANKTFGLVHNRSSANEILLEWGVFLIPLLLNAALRWRKKLELEVLMVVGGLVGLALVLQAGAVLVAVSLAIVWLTWRAESKQSVAFLLATGGLGIVMLCELVHLNDIFGDGLERLNTVFKFYMPAWVLMAAAAALSARELVARWPGRAGSAALTVWLLLLSGHLTAGLYARTGGYAQADSLDGYDAWSRMAGEDARLMQWARQQVLDGKLSGTLLEATGGAYQNFGRVMTASGLRGYFAWEGYGGMLQTLGNDPRIEHRMRTAKEIFKGVGLDGNCQRMEAKLAEEKIDFVVIGMIERQTFSESGLTSLQNCLPMIHAEGNSVFLSAKPIDSRTESLARGQGQGS